MCTVEPEIVKVRVAIDSARLEFSRLARLDWDGEPVGAPDRGSDRTSRRAERVLLADGDADSDYGSDYGAVTI